MRESMSFPGMDRADVSDDGSQMLGNLEQVEKSFELGKPERKMHTQIAIWFHNQLEKDYDVLKKQFDVLKSQNKKLQNQEMDLRGEMELDERWNTMVKCIRKLEMVMEGTEERISTEEHMYTFTAIYNMSIQRTLKPRLYDKYKESFVDYINSKVVPSLREKHDEFLLREFVRRWTNHKIMVKWLSHFFNPLRKYLERMEQPSLKQVGWACFRNLVYQEFRSKAADVIVGLICQEREGLLVDRALLKNAVNVFVEIEIEEGTMDCYKNDFERAMLDGTDAYYARKASEWSVQDPFPVYMLKAEECLKRERARVSHYLHSCSETKLLERVQNQLLVVPLNQLLENENSGCRALIRDDKVEDLSRMYKLFQQIPQGLEHIADVFMQHVVSEGMVLIKQTEDAINKNAKKKTDGAHEMELVAKLIKLQDKCLGYTNGCFSNNPRVHQALRKAFVAFCNKDVGGTSSAEILASYWDDMLKKGGAGKLDDEAIYETLDKLVNLLAYIDDKDVFGEFYRKKLSRRLLFVKNNTELEKTILTKLKEQCGGYFTSKMEGMVTDMTLAKENKNKFKEFLNGARLGMEFNATVLTTGRWPTYESSDLNLPAEMATCVEAFNDFYKSVTNRRGLTWIYSLGTCNINAMFEHKTMELIVSTYQAAVLLLFNAADRMSYSEIKAQSNLGDEDVIRVLHSLSCAKYKILNKVPNTKSVSVDDYFEFNSKFTEKMRRIKMVVPPPPVDEKKKVVEVVEKDRRHSIDCALVRIMKSRKVMGYKELVRECVEQLRLRFEADVKQIKKRIEDLIEQDYLEREKDNPNILKYLA